MDTEVVQLENPTLSRAQLARLLLSEGVTLETLHRTPEQVAKFSSHLGRELATVIRTFQPGSPVVPIDAVAGWADGYLLAQALCAAWHNGDKTRPEAPRCFQLNKQADGTFELDQNAERSGTRPYNIALIEDGQAVGRPDMLMRRIRAVQVRGHKVLRIVGLVGSEDRRRTTCGCVRIGLFRPEDFIRA